MVLLICILWVGYGFHIAQSDPLEKETIWVTFLHIVWYDKAAAGPSMECVLTKGSAETLLCLLVIPLCALSFRVREEGLSGSLIYSRLFVNSAVNSN